MTKTTNILIVGVGGQGTILASRILAAAAQRIAGEVKVSEIHGMAQRGGSVVTQVRFGDKVYSPIIQPGAADVILAFEKLEALRWIDYLKEDGTVIVNDQALDPMPVSASAAVYPEDVIGKLRQRAKQVVPVDALSLALAAGNGKAVNVVLLGVLSQFLAGDSALWQQALAEAVPEKFLAVNQKAFASGRELQR
ncbi:MAG: indolepyruvate oxidoreductase subunit beta [Peptococcaceae bacterium]|jgi:indolepyruvate ferredoxin oxidoreductase beta subunit|nr:indolepyruvate oxidoreductase subunit beta [Peptococcaceae bacterium]